MSRIRFYGFAALAGLILGVPLYGHHGTATSYDQKRVVKVTGIVKEFMWRNPHSGLYVEGKNEAGKVVTYSIEMSSPNLMVKLGYTRNSFKPGDETVVEMHPSFTNPTSGECLSCRVWINGKEQHPGK